MSPSRIASTAASVERSRSVSSMRSRNLPPVPGVEPVEQRRPRAADVQEAGRRRREAGDDLRHFHGRSRGRSTDSSRRSSRRKRPGKGAMRLQPARSLVAIAVLASRHGHSQAARRAHGLRLHVDGNDATVENALDLVEIARPLKLSTSASRTSAPTRDAAPPDGGHSRSRREPWMEIVATTRESELRGVELGRDLGVEMLMGGVHVEEALKLLGGSATRYLPFAGAPSGHPTRLGGSAPEVEAQCRASRERLRGRRHSRLSRDRGRAARPRRRLPARISRFRHGRGRWKYQFARNASPRFAPRARRFTIGAAAIEALLRARRRTARGAAQGGARRLRTLSMRDRMSRSPLGAEAIGSFDR